MKSGVRRGATFLGFIIRFDGEGGTGKTKSAATREKNPPHPGRTPTIERAGKTQTKGKHHGNAEHASRNKGLISQLKDRELALAQLLLTL